MFTKSITDIELESLIENVRVSLQLDFEKGFETLEQTLQLILKATEHSNFNSFKSNKLIWNVAGYINIISYDLKIVVRELTFSKNEWQKTYYARQASLLMYEGMNDILKLIGKDFRKEINLLSNSFELSSSLNHITKSINTFKIENEAKLKKVRNVSIAHRDRDIFQQIDTIKSIQWTEAINTSTAFNGILNELGELMQLIINKSVEELDK